MVTKLKLHRKIYNGCRGFTPSAIWTLWIEQAVDFDCIIKTTVSSYLDRTLQKVFGYKSHNDISDSMVEVYRDIFFLWNRGYGTKWTFWREVLFVDGKRKTLALLKGKLEIYKLAEKMKGY
jgi:hypothetical protein